jgi:hypothetical protein
LLRLAFTYGTPTTDNGNLTSQTIAAPGFSQTQYYGYEKRGKNGGQATILTALAPRLYSATH